MEYKAISVRPFIGAVDFDISRNFYRDLGFAETVLSSNMSVFKRGESGFYLQDAYVKDWVDNTMVFLEITDVDVFFSEVSALNLTTKYKNVRVSPVRTENWGKECFVHDPSGILWHFGEFY